MLYEILKLQNQHLYIYTLKKTLNSSKMKQILESIKYSFPRLNVLHSL